MYWRSKSSRASWSAIIDSGCDNTHPQLTHIRQGVDLTNPDDANGWTRDEIYER